MTASFVSTIDRIPPADLSAEMVVLGGVLVDPALLDDVRAIVAPADFYAALHEMAFLALVALRDRGAPIDKVSLASELRDQGMLDKIGGLAYLNSLMDTVQTTASVSHHARRVHDLAALRSLIHSGLKIVALGHDGEGDVSAAVSEAARLVRSVDEHLGADTGWTGRTLAQIQRDGVPPLAWDVEGILAAEDGPALLYGPPSAGKSWIALHMANCVATGQPFLGRYHVPNPRAGAIYVNLDAGATAIERRAVDVMRAAHPNVRIVSPRDGWDARAFERELARQPGSFVVIDSLADAFRAPPDQEQGEAAREFFRDLRRLYARHGCNGLVVDHANRSGGYYGSVQKLAAVRQMIGLEAVTDGPPTPGQIRVRFTCDKVSEAEKFSPFDALLDFAENGLTLTVAGATPVAETSKMRLLAKIEAEGPVTRSQVGADSGSSTRGTKADWLRLVAEGAIVRTGTRIGRADLWSTPEKMRESVLMGAALYPSHDRTREEPHNDEDLNRVHAVHPPAPVAPPNAVASATASAESGATRAREGSDSEVGARVQPLGHPPNAPDSKPETPETVAGLAFHPRDGFTLEQRTCARGGHVGRLHQSDAVCKACDPKTAAVVSV